jgi:protein-disulfide isomerase
MGPRRRQVGVGPDAREVSEAAGTQHKRPIRLRTIVETAVVGISIIVVVTGCGSNGVSAAKQTRTASQEPAVVTSLLQGIPQKGNTLGYPEAPLQYFGDLECPICKEFTLGALPSIIQKWVRTGKLKIEYRSLLTATGNAERQGAEPEGIFKNQQSAAMAAGKQNKAWNFIEIFYHEQGQEGSGYVTEKYIQGIARQVPGLNLAQWTSDRGDPELASEVTVTDAQAARNAGFDGTPSFSIGRTGGKVENLRYTSLTDPAPFELAISAAFRSERQPNLVVAAVTSSIRGIPQSGATLGNPKAPVTMQYFGDLECPVCKEFTLGALPGIIQNEVRTGKLKSEYRSLETATREPEVFRIQQVAAYAAGKQNKAWNFIETFYHEQGQEDSGYVTEKYIQGIAEQVSGLNLPQWQADRDGKELLTQVLTDEKAANEVGFNGTPSFLLGKTGQNLKPAFRETQLESSAGFEEEVNKLAS